MIGVGAIVVIVICGIIYIKYYRNNRLTTTDDVNKRNFSSEEGESPVVVDNILYGTSAEPIQDLYEEADKVDPVYSCADTPASYAVPDVKFLAEEVVYDCSKNETGETGHSIKLPTNDIYAAVVKKNKRT
uniref:uncharacterized protein LOC100177762 n=1 Tax=Ciona intestinalis TaxID=7719 RepID=UPI0002B8E403|nr:uncharacterized protein LOC100177762 [Ciona intestinalis]|eukprot:XP_002123018.2 uncharacterized protein LOC100177762 [Ciona intestinalis]